MKQRCLKELQLLCGVISLLLISFAQADLKYAMIDMYRMFHLKHNHDYTGICKIWCNRTDELFVVFIC
jgi:hypothetical protein